MSVITLNVNEAKRTLSASDISAFVINDKNVDIVRFALLTGFTDIALDEHSALRVMYQRPGETEVRAKTLTYYDTDGIRKYYDWELLSADLAEKGTLNCALCILRTDTEVEEWHTTPYQIRVLGSIHTDDSDEADESITPTVAQRVAILESMIQRVASGAPIVVSSASAMTDTDQIYVLSTDGEWYYHNGTAWVAGGEYGAVATDTTLTQSGIPADAEAVGNALLESKAVDVLTPEETEADLYICDNNGNVLAEFAAGHVRTKYFDSSDIDIEVTGDIYTAPSDSDADADISDVNGNVLARFKDGHFITKNFNSAYIRNLKGKKWTAVGDSLTESYRRATSLYHDYIAVETGITVVNMGHSGCGYAKVGGYGKNFIGIAAEIPADADIITVFGSGNDGSAGLALGTITDSTSDTVCGCINLALDTIYENHPTTPLGVITPTPWGGSEPSDGNSFMKSYAESIVNICANRGIPCLDLYHCSNLHPSDLDFRPLAYSRDDGGGVHPDETGHALIAPRIRQFLFSLI